MDVLEALREVGSDLYAGDPGGQRGKVRVPRVVKAVGEGRALDELVDKVDPIGREGSAEDADEAPVMAPADGGEPGWKLAWISVERALEDDGVAASEGAAPGGGCGGDGFG